MERIFSDFDNADPASVGGRSENISTPGTFVVEVEAVKCKKSDQYDAIYLIVEFKVLESEARKITRDAVEEAWSDSQPLTGETVRLVTSTKETKAGNPFTTHSWSPSI
jgi:homoserine kinase